MDESRLIRSARWALASFFVGVSALKLVDAAGSHSGFRAYPAPYLPLLVAIALLEAALGISLLTRFWRLASRGATLLVSGFAIYLSVMAWRGVSPAACGCFGSLAPSYGVHFVVILVALALSMVCACAPRALDRPT